MAAPTLGDFIKRRMVALRTNTVEIEKDYGLDADWIRGFIAGRGRKQPDEDRVRLLAKALKVLDRDLWVYLGRFDLVAAGEGEHLPSEAVPEWARALERRLEKIETAIAEVKTIAEKTWTTQGGFAERMGEEMGDLERRVTEAVQDGTASSGSRSGPPRGKVRP